MGRTEQILNTCDNCGLTSVGDRADSSPDSPQFMFVYLQLQIRKPNSDVFSRPFDNMVYWCENCCKKFGLLQDGTKFDPGVINLLRHPVR